MSVLIGRDFGLSLVRYRRPLAPVIASHADDVKMSVASAESDLPDRDGDEDEARRDFHGPRNAIHEAWKRVEQPHHPIAEKDRRFHWAAPGPRPADVPGLGESPF